MALGVVILQLLSCLGLGAMALRWLGISRELGHGERAVFAFAVGFGLLGWLLFPLGLLGLLAGGWLFGLLAAGAFGVILLLPKAGAPQSKIKPKIKPKIEPVDALGWALTGLVLLLALMDAAEALAPPGDADSLTYHFTSPKEFLKASRLVFISRPGDGAIPYLIQMTYLPPLALGGELALTLWAMVSSWGALALLFVLCRHHLGINWSLAVMLIFMSTPSVIYGAGTGQIETRMAMFAMIAAFAAARALETGHLRFALLAGLGVGFYAGAKYLGLLFALACGLVLLAQRRWLVQGLAFGAMTLLAGFQWYAWNAVHTGDPFFPVFFQWLGRDDLLSWTKEHDLFYKSVFMNYDRPVPRTFLQLFLFPFIATLDSPPIIESQHVGLGPFLLLVLPFSLLGAWKFRRQILESRLLIYAVIVFLFYILWFFSGPSQRVRHLVPVLPLLLICFAAAARRFASTASLRAPLVAALAASIGLQLAGSAVFSVKYVRHLASKDSREEFLQKNISAYAPVPWINANLAKTDRLFIGERQLFYFLEIPYLFSSPHTQSIVNTRDDQTDPLVLYKQMKAAGITHVLSRRLAAKDDAGKVLYSLQSLDRLSKTGCLSLVKHFQARGISSRTFAGSSSGDLAFGLLRLNGGSCAG